MNMSMDKSSTGGETTSTNAAVKQVAVCTQFSFMILRNAEKQWSFAFGAP